MIKGYQTLGGLGSSLEKIQSNIEDAFSPLTANPLIDGKLVKLNIKPGEDSSVFHGLKRAFNGYIPVKLRKLDGTPVALSTVYEVESSDESLYLKLAISGSDELTATIWVF
ncbi:MAG: hypothetical protein CL398_07290 [Acidiferrobacteraceae bacterium]|nr:hypothetical protein [Acidiferrobacteraceae bacterium]